MHCKQPSKLLTLLCKSIGTVGPLLGPPRPYLYFEMPLGVAIPVFVSTPLWLLWNAALVLESNFGKRFHWLHVNVLMYLSLLYFIFTYFKTMTCAFSLKDIYNVKQTAEPSRNKKPMIQNTEFSSQFENLPLKTLSQLSSKYMSVET